MRPRKEGAKDIWKSCRLLLLEIVGLTIEFVGTELN